MEDESRYPFYVISAGPVGNQLLQRAVLGGKGVHLGKPGELQMQA